MDRDEPERVQKLAMELELKHIVVTSVTRDDLSDGGAQLFVETITKLKNLSGVTVEVLTPDFLGNREAITHVLNAEPDVFNHNLETIRRLHSIIRPQADYERSLAVLQIASERSPAIKIKSGLMVGLGETDEELLAAMEDLLQAGCKYLTIGQYLAPSKEHAHVERYVHPATFNEYKQKALSMGFAAVASGPLVRSSYRAEELLQQRSYAPV